MNAEKSEVMVFERKVVEVVNFGNPSRVSIPVEEMSATCKLKKIVGYFHRCHSGRVIDNNIPVCLCGLKAL